MSYLFIQIQLLKISRTKSESCVAEADKEMWPVGNFNSKHVVLENALKEPENMGV